MAENPSPPPSESDKLAATLAALEAERQRRLNAGQWSRGTLPILRAIVGDDETDDQAMERVLAEHLKEHAGDPKSIHAYQWMLLVPFDPPPAVELPGEQYAPDHADAVDVTPPPRRPPPSPPPSSSTRSLPPPPGAGALSADPARMNIPARIHDAEQRRTRNFNDDTWGNPSDWPIRYPRGNRSGW